MSYVDAALAPMRKTGQIKLHGPKPLPACARPGSWSPNASTCWRAEVKPGVPTEHIDQLVFEFAMDHGALPATLMYRGYSKSTCTSINHVVCHGIPNDKPLKEGDIVNIDVTLILDGWHGDSSRMYRGRRNPAPRRTPDRGHLRCDDARHRRDQARRAPPAISALRSRPMSKRST